MRTLRADLRTLRRPLTYWAVTITALFGVLLLLAGAQNAQSGIASPSYRPPTSITCVELGLPAGAACNGRITAYQEFTRIDVIQQQNQSRARAIHAAAADRGYLNPVQSGTMAAGLMSSLPGAFIIALVAAGHIGGKWTRRTIRTQLLTDARRTRLLISAWASTWLVSLVLLATTWLALAVSGPLLQSIYHLPGTPPSLGQAWTATWPIVARSILTTAVFAAIAAAAAVVTRSTIGTLSLTVGALMTALIAGSLTALSHATPASWVAAWMHFPTRTYIVTSFWNAPAASGGSTPSTLAGATGLLGLLACCLLGAALLLRRQNVTS